MRKSSATKRSLKHSQALNAKLSHENALLKRMKFAAQSERFNAEQRSLFEDEIEADLAAVAVEIEQIQPPAAAPEAEQQPKHQPLLANLQRREIRHEPESTICACGYRMQRIGEDVAEKLDYVPGVLCSPWSVTFVASGPARSARPSPRRQSRPM